FADPELLEQTGKLRTKAWLAVVTRLDPVSRQLQRLIDEPIESRVALEVKLAGCREQIGPQLREVLRLFPRLRNRGRQRADAFVTEGAGRIGQVPKHGHGRADDAVVAVADHATVELFQLQ